MSARPRKITPERVQSAVEAANAAGLRVGAWEFGTDGTIRAVLADYASPPRRFTPVEDALAGLSGQRGKDRSNPQGGPDL